VDEWLEAARGRLAGAADLAAAELDLSEAAVDELLELARIAAHESGERTNAPLLCYLVGLARGRADRDLSVLVDATVGKAV
jgi:hypothetical protein